MDVLQKPVEEGSCNYRWMGIAVYRTLATSLVVLGLLVGCAQPQPVDQIPSDPPWQITLSDTLHNGLVVTYEMWYSDPIQLWAPYTAIPESIVVRVWEYSTVFVRRDGYPWLR